MPVKVAQASASAAASACGTATSQLTRATDWMLPQGGWRPDGLKTCMISASSKSFQRQVEAGCPHTARLCLACYRECLLLPDNTQVILLARSPETYRSHG